MSSAGTRGRLLLPTDRTAGQRDPKLCVSPLRARRDVRTVRPTCGSSSASNPVSVSCCVSNASAPPHSASSFRGRRFDEPRPSSRASRSRIVIARTPATSAVSSADPIQQDPTLVGGGLRLRFGNVQAGLRSISVQDGVGLFAGIDYLKATEGDRWRSGWSWAGRVPIVSLVDDVGATRRLRRLCVWPNSGVPPPAG